MHADGTHYIARMGLDSLDEQGPHGCSYVTYSMSLHVVIGFEVSTVADGRKHIRAAMVVMSCDLPARALVLNMRQFNGQQGCHLCEDPGENAPATPMLRWWPYRGNAVQRTKISLLKNSLEVAQRNEIVSSTASGIQVGGACTKGCMGGTCMIEGSTKKKEKKLGCM